MILYFYFMFELEIDQYVGVDLYMMKAWNLKCWT
jgi:hypothetical protein